MIRVFGHASALRHQAIAFTAICFAFGGLAFAQELSTDAERTHAQLRSAKDAKTRYLAERWYNLVRLQEWKSLDGKFTTTAKYVDHDPNLAWVKLRTVKGTGADRVVKDATIPLGKLSKTCQSRVRQIANLTEKVKAAAVEATTAKEEDEAERDGSQPATVDSDEDVDDQAAEEGPASPRRERGRRRPPRGEQVDEQADEQAADRRRPRRERSPRNTTPLPGRLPPLPAGTSSSVDAPTQHVDVSQNSPGSLTKPASDAWRTDYEAFRANIKPTSVLGAPEFDFGPMRELQSAFNTMRSYESVGDEEYAEIDRHLVAAGEVQWETTLAGTSDREGDWTEALGLPPLADDFDLVFVLDPDQDPGPWQQLKAGDHVKFVGRFEWFHEETGLTIAIRFPKQAATAPPATVTDRSP